MFDFQNKVVVITGGTRGIGLATVKAFAKLKAQVILFGSKEATVTQALKTLKEENLLVAGYYPNLSDYNEVENTFKDIIAKYQKIDVLINNAGITAKEKITQTTSEDFQNIMNINVLAMFNTIKAVVPYLQKQNYGVILNTSSMVSIYGQPTGVGYPASKWAVNGLTKSLARELAPYHIRVNAVAPGIIKTQMVSQLPSEVINPLIAKIPLGRIGEVEDIANAFLFLASDMASYITGVILPVDGAAYN